MKNQERHSRNQKDKTFAPRSHGATEKIKRLDGLVSDRRGFIQSRARVSIFRFRLSSRKSSARNCNLPNVEWHFRGLGSLISVYRSEISKPWFWQSETPAV